MNQHFPFSALVGQEMMKRALLINVVDPTIGGVLIKGERGTAKTTGVRALVDLLPTIRVISGCHFQCDPEDPGAFCPDCAKKHHEGQPLNIKERKIRLVNLPIGTTEDRLLGTIDIENAIKSGQKSFEPGLLAEAHRSILYVDEVNLLNDQIVDLFLDVAASGVNLVEREGISFSHASRFVLVGTMNPEEGDLRPQLLDRFGLSVNIAGIHSLADRVEIIKRRLTFEQSPEAFRASWAGRDAELARSVLAAKESLSRVTFSENLLETAAKIAMAMEADGHRADIVMMKAARAHAVLEGRLRVSMEDLQLAARLVLPHRMKKSPLHRTDLNEDRLREVIEQSVSIENPGGDWSPVHQNSPKAASMAKSYNAPIDSVTHLCTGIKRLNPHLPWYKLMTGTHPGRRFAIADLQKNGTVQGSRLPRMGELMQDFSFVGTLRAAAPHQKRRNGQGILNIRGADLRLRKRSRKTGLSLVLILDSSASMRTNDMMSVTKGIVEAMCRDIYLKRDKLGIITFRNTRAEVILPLSQNPGDALVEIERLPVGGRTPLAAGLDLGIRLLVQEKRKNPETLPLMLIFSDGRPNVSCFGGDPLQEAFFFAREVKHQGIEAILVDTHFNPMSIGYGYEITQRMSGTYLTMDQLCRKK
jgi:magnesium chelatase subunit D